jgi:PKD repeat protein
MVSRALPLIVAVALSPEVARAQALDVLFVVDNSAGMTEKQAVLAAGLHAFLDPLLASPVDFHLGVVSTDMSNPAESGRLLAPPGNPTILTRETADLPVVLAAAVQLGKSGDGFEKGLQAMEAALSPPLVDAENRGFLRPDARLLVLFVSDEEDCSHERGAIPELDGDECVRNVDRMIPVEHYVDFLTRLKADPGLVFGAAIVGPDLPLGPEAPFCSADHECPSLGCFDGRCCPPDLVPLPCSSDADCTFATSCAGQRCLPLPSATSRPYAPTDCSCFTPVAGRAAPGTRYIDVVRALGRNGLYGSSCAPDWGETLARLARLVVPAIPAPGPPPGPPLSVDAGGPYFGAEGSPISFHGTVSSLGGPLDILWDFGDGATGAGLDPVHAYADNGRFSCQLTVTQGPFMAHSRCEAVVANVIPVVAPFPGATLLEGDAYSAAGSFVDFGADVWVATVDYGDGSGVQPLTLSQRTFHLSHTYFRAGTYTVTVSVADDDDRRPGIAQATVVVLTPAQAIQALSAFVDRLVASGGLELGNATSLKAKLDAALHQLGRGNVRAATNQLEAFLHEAAALEKVGRLESTAARRLTDDARRIILRINHVDPPPVCACPASPIQAAPLQTVTLSGAVCSDAEGQPLQFAWTVEQRPPGSTAPLSGADSAQASLFLDTATTAETPYVVRVSATDPVGQSASCAYTVLAVPDAGLHVQLVWDTDRSDLDVHLLDDVGTENRFRPEGWFNTVNDCFYLNRAPDWGVFRDRTDDPHLDIDDVSGFGPEVIGLAEPEAKTYTIGVHYFCDAGIGTTTATVRVFCDGALAAELARPLGATGAFWEVAEVTFPGCTVRPLGVTSTVPQGCTAGPPAVGLACEILTPPSPLRQGQTLAFVAVAKNANGAIVPGQAFTWRSDNTGAVTVDANGVATGGGTAGVANLTCRVVGGLAADSPPVAVHNYADVEPGMVRAVVFDPRSGAPVPGASVLFEPLGAVVTTGGEGIAQAPAAGTINVHVFKAGYTWVSIVGTNASDILVPLLLTPDDTKAGGFKGGFDMSLVPNPQDSVEFGFAGASLPGSFIDLDFTKLLGEVYRYRVKIGNLFDDFLALPSGLLLKIGDQAIKGEYTAVAEPGRRDAWAIGGKIPFDKLLAILTPILGGGGDPANIPFGQIIAQILPLFEDFLHFVKTDVSVTEVPKVPDTGDINGNGSMTDLVPDFGNPVGFPTVTARVSQPLSLATSLAVPPLPQYNSTFLEGVVVLSGANVAGRGLVPLGLTAAVDAPAPGETPDGFVDVDPVTPGNQSTVTFKMSPRHDGLEGSRFFFATLALSLRVGTGSSTSVSGIITQTDQVGPDTMVGSSFLGFPETASFDPFTRRFELGVPVANGTFHRADFKGPDGDWRVYFKAPAGAGVPAFVLPVPPGAGDRAVAACDGGQPCTRLRVLTLATAACLGGPAPDLDAISAFGTVNLGRLDDCLAAFSSEGCQSSGSCAPPAAP